MTTRKVCVICGFRRLKNQWEPHELPAALKDLGFEGKWAHASCVVKAQKYQQARRKLLALREDE